MKVLHLISSGGMYGAEAVILNLSGVLNSTHGDRSIIGVFGNSAKPNLELHEAALRAGVESHVLPCQSQLDRATFQAIRDLRQSSSADIVHAHGYKADVYVWLALRKSKTPLISTCHTWYDNDFAVRLYGAVDRQILRRFDGVVAVSDQVRLRLLDAGVPADRIRLIRNGIDLRPFADVPTNRAGRHSMGSPLTIGLVGRLSREKGIDVFIGAAAEVARRQPGTQFVVAGDGPDRVMLEEQIAQLGLQENVRLPGRTNDMKAFYSSIDVLVSASREEGLPIALLEGMASGLPVVATPVGAVPQVIPDDRTGLLVNPEDPRTLAEAICNVIDDKALRDRLGRAAQQRIAEEFSASRMAAEYVELYRSVLEQKNSAGESAIARMPSR